MALSLPPARASPQALRGCARSAALDETGAVSHKTGAASAPA
jgi:hypothetical protein